MLHYLKAALGFIARVIAATVIAVLVILILINAWWVTVQLALYG